MSEAVVERACAKLRSTIGDEAEVRLNFTSDLQEMLDALEVIQPVLETAEMQLLDRTSFTGWLQQVRHAAYRIMDIIDELHDTREQAAAAKMTRMLPRLAIKKNSMTIKLEEMKREVTELAMHYLFYIAQQRPSVMYERITRPFLEEASVFGRGLDKQRIVFKLLSAASNITQGPPNCTILPIFGLPGSGKTTLAQLVFNDDTNSLQEYKFRVWVHVSAELDFHRIGESILSQVMCINDHGPNSDVMEMESTMERLHELLNGKKVLLVLDDLWEEDPIQVQLLKSMLTYLGDKVDVIVTTCNQAIARKICTLEPYRLNPLDDDACWEIIKKSIPFAEEDEELETIGWEMARRCQGLPSVAQAYARMLYSRDPISWIWITEKDTWECIFGDNSGSALLLSTLKLYRSMPPDLRVCFAYCCNIFPKGYNIVKIDLIHQWLALNLIQPSERSSAIKIAEGYITRLLDMSFLRTAKSDRASGSDDKGATMFTMHDLAHHFATLDEFTTPCWHYMLVTGCRGKLDNRYDNHLRALHWIGCGQVEFNDDSFSSKRSLRVLELKESSVQKLPDSICKLRHLGYLQISEFSRLVTLPESFGDLTNLFHVDLSGCSGLTALPESFGDLINLSHVNLSRCHALAELPEPLQKLGKLVHLDLSFWSCFEEIGECLAGLSNLEHLNLSHPCCHLPRHRSHLHGLKDGLCKLTNLRYLNLSMCLNPIFYYHQSQEDSLQYIGECLRGISNLEHLDLSHNTFLFYLPESLGNHNKLHTLNLSGCIRLKRVGEIKSLKFIALTNCHGLERCNFVVRIVDDGDACRSSSNIVQLEEVNCKELQISCLEKVRSKEEAQRIKLVEKQKLEKLKLSWTLDSLRSVEDRCLLEVIVPTPNIQCLEVNGYDGTCLPDYLGDLTSLRGLTIVCCKQLNSLPNSIQKLTNLKVLSIFDCPDLENWCQLEENKKMLAHIPNKNYEEHGSASRPEIEDDCRSTDIVTAV